ncbi:MAG TPA: DUF4097 family beta strand repeat-containing protein [Pyrinomonadaceae bacterium]|nr:DUF4097 family beta strand repeat-containing protein [Pyrinomonadaceae bacterium]
MKMCLFDLPSRHPRAHLLSVLAVLALLGVAGVSSAVAQQRIQKKYPTGKNVRLQLKNISGEIIVESWDRDEIKVSATMESPAARFSPRQTSDGLLIDVMGDNRGRGEVGNINFKVQVPVSSSVDVETMRGDIHVFNIQGGAVRARVSSEGDIQLSGISASQVVASNTIGDIFFDGDLKRGGSYEFTSNKGNITLRIPGDSAFRLVAATPSKKIELGPFWNNRFQSIGDGRKIQGDVGDGRASVTVTNFRGSISFLRR